MSLCIRCRLASFCLSPGPGGRAQELWPPTSSLLLSLCSTCTISGAAAALCSRSRNKQINPFLGSSGETASSFNPILNQGQGVIPENVGTGRRFLWPLNE